MSRGTVVRAATRATAPVTAAISAAPATKGRGPPPASVGRAEGGSPELDAGQRGRRGVGQVGPEDVKRPPMMDSMTSAHTKTPMTPASWERTSEPMPAPSAPTERAPTTAPATWADEGARAEGTWSPWPATKMSPTAGGDEPGDQAEDGPGAGCGHVLGGEHPPPVRGAEVGEGGGVVAELAAGDDHPEHGGEDHRQPVTVVTVPSPEAVKSGATPFCRCRPGTPRARRTERSGRRTWRAGRSRPGWCAA